MEFGEFGAVYVAGGQLHLHRVPEVAGWEVSCQQRGGGAEVV